MAGLKKRKHELKFKGVKFQILFSSHHLSNSIGHNCGNQVINEEARSVEEITTMNWEGTEQGK